jgi:protein ImuA
VQAAKNDIINQLRRDILPWQGLQAPPAVMGRDIGLGFLSSAFPHGCFPTGAVHEFISTQAEDAAATGGFMAALLGSLMENNRVCVWIGSSRTLFPPALKYFGVDPGKVIFVDLQKERDILWATEEALKCEGLGAVVGELSNINFTASRRLQLVVEQSRVTGFILRHQPKQLNTVACVSRWKIKPLPSEGEENMPGVGFPRWNVELLKIRNGKPGKWTLEWSGGSFHPIYTETLYLPLPQERLLKIG